MRKTIPSPCWLGSKNLPPYVQKTVINIRLMGRTNAYRLGPNSNYLIHHFWRQNRSQLLPRTQSNRLSKRTIQCNMSGNCFPVTAILANSAAVRV